MESDATLLPRLPGPPCGSFTWMLVVPEPATFSDALTAPVVAPP